MKHIAYALCMGLGAVLMFSGCSGIEEMNKSLGEATTANDISTLGLKIIKNKTTRNEIFRAIGAPGLVFNDKTGETWVYNRVAVRQSALGLQTKGNFAALFPYHASNLSHGGGMAGAGASATVGTNRSSYKSAGLLIKFNRKGCVNSYEFTATSF